MFASLCAVSDELRLGTSRIMTWGTSQDVNASAHPRNWHLHACSTYTDEDRQMLEKGHMFVGHVTVTLSLKVVSFNNAALPLTPMANTL